MYVYMYIYIYIYIHTCVYIYIYVLCLRPPGAPSARRPSRRALGVRTEQSSHTYIHTHIHTYIELMYTSNSAVLTYIVLTYMHTSN